MVFLLLFTFHFSHFTLAESPPQDFDKTSLSLRTALHYDPSVEAPLKKLVELYRGAGRSEELLGLYENHVSQFAQDANAKLVLARLYAEVKDRRAAGFLAAAITLHPEHALLAWQNARVLEERRDPKTAEEMARAIGLETSASRRVLWFASLMKRAAHDGREDLVIGQVQKFLDENAMTPEQRLRWARQALAVKLVKTSQLLQNDLDVSASGPDIAMEAAVLRAELMAADGRREDAAKLLDTLLEKLAPDHWRRRELLMLRLDLSGPQGRDALVESLRAKWRDGEKTEAGAMPLADVLEASHRRREALEVLREAAKVMPESRTIEARLLEVWEREGTDEAALAWLDDALKKDAARDDLQLRRVRWLFAAGKVDAAKSAFDALLSRLDADQQAARGVELARWLRRRNQPSDAGAILEVVLRQAPQRWDLRRELAEIYFAQRRKDDAVKLFSVQDAAGLTPEARLENAQFLIARKMWSEARVMVEPWIAQQPGAIEGRMLLAKICDKIGDDARATAEFDAARALCDTEERYQGWLDAVVSFAESREQTAAWIRLEAGRLDHEEGDPKGLLRIIAMIQQAKSRREEKLAEELLVKVTANKNLPADKKLALEKLRLELLASDTTRSSDTEAGFRRLIETDEAHRDDHRAGLALFYRRAERRDLAAALLVEMDPAKCTEVETLRALPVLFREMNLVPQAMAAMEKLTRLEPGERAHWAQWIGLLAENGDEERLRVALRGVLAKAADWQFRPEVLDELQAHLIASMWRDVLNETVAGGAERWAAARRTLAELQASDTGTPEQLRWADWLSGYLSMKLSDQTALNAVLEKLAKLDGKQWITFPDGMELSVEQGRRWLQSMTDSTDEKPEFRIKEPGSTGGPLPPLDFRWGFSLDEGRIITRVVAPEGSRMVLVCDDAQIIHAVDRSTGKLHWSSGGTKMMSSSATSRAASARSTNPMIISGGMRSRSGYYYNSQPEYRLPLEAAVQEDRVLFLSGGDLVCVRLLDGVLLWRSRLAVDANAFTATKPRLAISAGRAVVWEPDAARVTAFDLKNGKAVWSTMLPAPPSPAPNPMGNYNMYYDPYAATKPGIRVDGADVLVFGSVAALLDARDGMVRWRLGAGELPGFPINLSTAADGVAAPAKNLAPQMIMMGGKAQMVRPWSMPVFNTITSQRWAHGHGIRALMQNNPATLLLNRGAVWALTMGNSNLVSFMGLPVARPEVGGTFVGFAGDALVTLTGGSVFSVSAKADAKTQPLFHDVMPDGPRDAAGGITSAAVAGTRVYAATARRLRCADIRSGEVVFDTPMPAEIEEWRKSLEPKLMLQPVMTGMNHPGMLGGHQYQPGGVRNPLPGGVLIQDARGGGVLCANTSVASGSSWIIPVNDRALACISTAPAQTSTKP